MPAYTSPDAGDITAPDPYTAARWLMHRLAHQRHGERAIVRQFEAAPLDTSGTTWTADAWIGAPAPGAGALHFAAIYLYDVDAMIAQASYY